MSAKRSLMNKPYITFILLVGLFISCIIMLSGATALHLPDNQQDYAPIQPISYSHRLHAGELKIDCMYCHSNAAESRHAGIPSGDVCMKCHKFVTASFNEVQAENKRAEKEKTKAKRIISPELAKLYESMAVDQETMKPIEGKEAKGIDWVRVHNLPDYVYFDHSAHVSKGVSCQKCHGPIEEMQRVKQFSTLSMGWCVNCHRETKKTGVNGMKVHPTTDCAACHY